jgi:hypothetical protein
LAGLLQGREECGCSDLAFLWGGVEVGLREGDKCFGFDGKDGWVLDRCRLGAGAPWSQSCFWPRRSFDR